MDKTPHLCYDSREIQGGDPDAGYHSEADLSSQGQYPQCSCRAEGTAL